MNTEPRTEGSKHGEDRELWSTPGFAVARPGPREAPSSPFATLDLAVGVFLAVGLLILMAASCVAAMSAV